jgi:hypothetical protein
MANSVPVPASRANHGGQITRFSNTGTSLTWHKYIFGTAVEEGRVKITWSIPRGPVLYSWMTWHAGCPFVPCLVSKTTPVQYQIQVYYPVISDQMGMSEPQIKVNICAGLGEWGIEQSRS